MERFICPDMGACFGRCFLTGDKGLCLRFSSNDDQFNNLVDENNKSPENTESLIFRIMKTKSKKHSKFTDRFWSGRELNNYSRLNKNNHTASIGSDIQLQCLDAHSLLIAAREQTYAFNTEMYTGLTASPVGSSLDLEWEHEYNQNPNWTNSLPAEEVTPNGGLSSEDDCSSNHSELHKQTKKHRNFNTTPTNNQIQKRYRRGQRQATGNSSVNSWSHISTPDSLEWDVDEQENHFKSEDSLDQETKDLLNEIEQLKNRVLSETGTVITTTNNEEEAES